MFIFIFCLCFSLSGKSMNLHHFNRFGKYSFYPNGVSKNYSAIVFTFHSAVYPATDFCAHIFMVRTWIVPTPCIHECRCRLGWYKVVYRPSQIEHSPLMCSFAYNEIVNIQHGIKTRNNNETLAFIYYEKLSA